MAAPLRIPTLVALAGVALAGCDHALPSAPEAQPGAVAAAVAPLTGLTEGADYADHGCEIVLREASVGDCDGTECELQVRFELRTELLNGGAVAKVLVTAGDGQWWEAPASPTGADAASAFTELETHATLPAGDRYALVPFYSAEGARIFDHNVLAGDLDNYRLDAGNGYALETPADACPGEPATADGPPVQLVHAWSNQCPPTSGCTADEELRGLIEVANLAYDKKVSVVHQRAGGDWSASPASYVGPSRPGFELWGFDIDGAISAFALSYEVAGATWWDNNGGQDYAVGSYTIDALLRDGRDVAVGWARDLRSSAGYVHGAVIVRDHSYHKDVSVRVGDDAGLAAVEVEATWYRTLPSGHELWQFKAPIDPTLSRSALRISARYGWEGGSAEDDNFGRYYRLEDSGLTY